MKRISIYYSAVIAAGLTLGYFHPEKLYTFDGIHSVVVLIIAPHLLRFIMQRCRELDELEDSEYTE